MSQQPNRQTNLPAPVLVTGAAGFVGQETCRQLLAAAVPVRAMVHHHSPAWFDSAGLEVVQADLRNRADLDRAVEGVRAVVHLAARKADEADSYEVNVGGARALAAASLSAGVGRIVNVSTQAATYARRDRYGLSKAEADQVIQDAPIEHVTLVPSLVYGDDETGVFAKLRDAVRKLPVVPVIGDGSAIFQPVHVADLARAIVAALMIDPLPRTRYFVGGPEALTFEHIIDLAEGDVPRRKPRIHLPWRAMLLGTQILRRLLPRPPITVSNVLGASSRNREIHSIQPMIEELRIVPRRMGDWASEQDVAQGGR